MNTRLTFGKDTIFSIPFSQASDVDIFCQTALTRLTDTWLSAFNNCQISGAVFYLDICEAFGIVNHNILLKKLSACDLSTVSITFLQFYRQGRLQYVLVMAILPRNIYHVWSSSRADPRPPCVAPFCLDLY